MLFPVILSGGSGSRLWPLSRHNQPKQFLKLIGDNSLYQETIERVSRLPNVEHTITVCSEDHRFMVGEQLAEIDVKNGDILLEPVARNTAAAIALAALQVASVDANGQLLVLPADHLIEKEQAFAGAVEKAQRLAQSGKLVAFGINPDCPETGYGYIKGGAALAEDGSVIEQFVEKPDLPTAEQYVASGKYFWNSGMFLFTAQSYLDELVKLEPEIYAAAKDAFALAKRDLDFVRFDKAAFERSPDISIDYAVMEKTDNAAVVPVSCGWSDIGSWSSMWQASERDDDDNHHNGDVISLDTKRTLVRASDRRMVAVIGCEDIVVIDTPDATLVARRDRVQDVKKIVDRLKKDGRQEHLFHRKVYRPWGNYDSLDNGERFQVKRIVVKPGAALSLQKHHKRAEHWIVVSGVAEVTCDDKVFELRENESTYIPLGSVHRLKNNGTELVELIEVQSGSYLGEDDIVRLEDVYGRS